MSAKRRLWNFHGGLHLQDHKAESTQLPLTTLAVPASVTLPLQQHIGAPAEVLVRVGQKVGKGELLARAKDYISAPVHASTSGTVVAIEPRPIPHPSGMPGLCVVIDADGEDRWAEGLPAAALDYTTLSPVELRNKVREAGIVGLGGAAFPTSVKLNPGNHALETLVVNGAECEPYISCDDMLMRHYAAEIVSGIAIVQQMTLPRETLIGIEDNKPEAIAAMQAALKDAGLSHTEVVTVPSIYPTGGEKQLIKVLTGKEVPSLGLPLSIGVLCQNIGTLFAVHNAIIGGVPLIERLMTVSGDAVQQPRNLRVRFGTPIADLVAAAGGYNASAERLIMGGPMMGFAMSNDSLPVTKSTNCILVASNKIAPPPADSMACIRCGECAKVCPANLLPQQLYWYSHARDFEKAQDYHLFDCIECGCCALVCPSQLPLVQHYRFAKTEIWQQEKRRAKSDRARERHEFRGERLDKAAREKAERLAKKKAVLAAPAAADSAATPAVVGSADDAKKAAIAAALERVKAKKAAADSNTGADPTDRSGS